VSASSGAFSWNSELPSGRSPFWVTDDALSGLGLHKGDAVSVDTRAEPEDGDLVVVEAEVDDDSRRIARRYFAIGDRIRLESIDGGTDALELPQDSVIVMGVIAARLRFSASGDMAIEEPLALES